MSGAVTSGAGYAIWYRVLKDLTATRASIVQLSVPVIAAIGGVVFVSEPLTLRLSLATIFILGGIALTLMPNLGFPRNGRHPFVGGEWQYARSSNHIR